MADFRIEKDSLGLMQVPAEHCWGAQTQRSFENFPIGIEKMPDSIIRAFALLKKAAAETNAALRPEKMTAAKCGAIVDVCDRILDGRLTGPLTGPLKDEFPLKVWQTGSGTQTNMNMNEVIAYCGSHTGFSTDACRCDADGLKDDACRWDADGRPLLRLHPNDDVNMSQSSNDTFPTAMNVAFSLALEKELLPVIDAIIRTFSQLEEKNRGIIKSGRTHLMDAVPIAFSQEISGWRGMLETDRRQIEEASKALHELAIGGTAVGTGLNAPPDFGELCARRIAEATGIDFRSAVNKFRALTSADGAVFAHGALKALAADLMKIANDIRWLASGPRCGLSEIHIPANEPGSSIMPGKVNPTQCESITMIAVQVIGNDAAIGMAASQGNFQLNVFLPVIAYNFLQSARLLTDGIRSFEQRCVSGITANREVMEANLNRSLMLVTALSPTIGYDNAAAIAHYANENGTTLKEAAHALGLLEPEEYDRLVRPETMI